MKPLYHQILSSYLSRREALKFIKNTATPTPITSQSDSRPIATSDSLCKPDAPSPYATDESDIHEYTLILLDSDLDPDDIRECGTHVGVLNSLGFKTIVLLDSAIDAACHGAGSPLSPARIPSSDILTRTIAKPSTRDLIWGAINRASMFLEGLHQPPVVSTQQPLSSFVPTQPLSNTYKRGVATTLENMKLYLDGNYTPILTSFNLSHQIPDSLPTKFATSNTPHAGLYYYTSATSQLLSLLDPKGLNIKTSKFIVIRKNGGLSTLDSVTNDTITNDVATKLVVPSDETSKGKVADAKQKPGHIPLVIITSSPNQTTTFSQIPPPILAILPLLPPTASAYLVPPLSLLNIHLTTNPSIPSTTFRMAPIVQKHTSLQTLDRSKFTRLVEETFGRRLRDGFYEGLEGSMRCVVVVGDYDGVVVMRRQPEMYLDKFVVSRERQGMGVSDILWKWVEKEGDVVWRSRVGNPVNKWYFEKSAGFVKRGIWIVFWVGRARVADVSAVLAVCDSFE